ncbi:helix-turn-helix domain-containing protein [Nonomuraea terrae]|uniref:helix-turn-helix domain-containing protein n=1 Tax=Nonomuraea terrae TaxID=2530383 RepID=UPI00378E4CF8
MTAEDLSVPAAEVMILGHYDKPAGYATRRSYGSPSWLLMWTEAGAGRITQGGTSFEVGPGDLAVLASGAAQHYRVAPGARRWRFWWVHFQPRASWTAWLAPYAREGGCHLVSGVPRAVRERIAAAFVRAHHDAHWTPATPSVPPGALTGTPSVRPSSSEGIPVEREPADAWKPGGLSVRRDFLESAGAVGSDGAPYAGGGRVPVVVGGGAARELVLGAVEEVVVLATASARPRAGTPEEGDERIRRVLTLIAADPAAPHSVASLARAVALSPSRFAHLFAAETGRTPMHAVRQARVRHAASLLEITDMDVGQVAAACGFVSPFHFSRAFRRAYGVPPREYRARVRSAPG